MSSPSSSISRQRSELREYIREESDRKPCSWGPYVVTAILVIGAAFAGYYLMVNDYFWVGVTIQVLACSVGIALLIYTQIQAFIGTCSPFVTARENGCCRLCRHEGRAQIADTIVQKAAAYSGDRVALMEEVDKLPWHKFAEKDALRLALSGQLQHLDKQDYVDGFIFRVSNGKGISLFSLPIIGSTPLHSESNENRKVWQIESEIYDVIKESDILFFDCGLRGNIYTFQANSPYDVILRFARDLNRQVESFETPDQQIIALRNIEENALKGEMRHLIRDAVQFKGADAISKILRLDTEGEANELRKKIAKTLCAHIQASLEREESIVYVVNATIIPFLNDCFTENGLNCGRVR